MKRSRRIEALLGVILAIVLVFFIKTIFKQYGYNKEIISVKSQIGAIYNGMKMSVCDRDWQNYKIVSVNTLEYLGYITLDRELKKSWNFSLDYPKTISAQSNNNCRYGDNVTLYYDIIEGIFYLNGNPCESGKKK